MNLQSLDLGYLAPTNPSLRALRSCQSLESLTLRANVGETQFDEMFASSSDDSDSMEDDDNCLRNLRFLSLTVTIKHAQLAHLFRCCQKLVTLRLHLFDLLPTPPVRASASLNLTRRQLRQVEALRSAADNPFLLMVSPTMSELQMTTCKDVAMIESRSNGKIPRDFFKAANQLPSLKKFSSNIFSNVNGYKEPETFMTLALDRATCLLPPLMITLALKCKKFTHWRDIRNLLGNDKGCKFSLWSITFSIFPIEKILSFR